MGSVSNGCSAATNHPPMPSVTGTSRTSVIGYRYLTLRFMPVADQYGMFARRKDACGNWQCCKKKLSDATAQRLQNEL